MADYIDPATCAAHRREVLRDAKEYTDQQFQRSETVDDRMWSAIDDLRREIGNATKWISRAVTIMLVTVIGEILVAFMLYVVARGG